MSDNGKVYAIVYDNGEPYEDGNSYTVAVYKTREAAKKYLDSKYDRTKGWNGAIHWVNRHEQKKCSKGHTYNECEECPIFIEWENHNFANDYECKEIDDVEQSYFAKAYDNAWYEIEEWVVED